MKQLARKLGLGLACAGLMTFAAPPVVLAADPTIKIRVQSVIPTTADEITMLKDFAADVSALTDNTVTFEVLPAGAVVAVADTLHCCMHIAMQVRGHLTNNPTVHRS